MREPKVEPCVCGTDVEVKYMAGISKSLREIMQNPVAESNPIWYIHCAKCGSTMKVGLMRQDDAYRMKNKIKLIRKWNKTMAELKGENKNG